MDDRTGAMRVRPSKPKADERPARGVYWPAPGGGWRVVLRTARGSVCGLSSHCLTPEAAEAWARRQGVADVCRADGGSVGAMDALWTELVTPFKGKEITFRGSGANGGRRHGVHR